MTSDREFYFHPYVFLNFCCDISIEDSLSGLKFVGLSTFFLLEYWMILGDYLLMKGIVGKPSCFLHVYT